MPGTTDTTSTTLTADQLKKKWTPLVADEVGDFLIKSEAAFLSGLALGRKFGEAKADFEANERSKSFEPWCQDVLPSLSFSRLTQMINGAEVYDAWEGEKPSTTNVDVYAALRATDPKKRARHLKYAVKAAEAEEKPLKSKHVTSTRALLLTPTAAAEAQAEAERKAAEKREAEITEAEKSMVETHGKQLFTTIADIGGDALLLGAQLNGGAETVQYEALSNIISRHQRELIAEAAKAKAEAEANEAKVAA